MSKYFAMLFSRWMLLLNMVIQIKRISKQNINIPREIMNNISCAAVCGCSTSSDGDWWVGGGSSSGNDYDGDGYKK